MKPSRKYELFISHSAEDMQLAESLEALLVDSIEGLSKRRVFRSSEGTRLELGKPSTDQIIHALNESKLCIGLLTPLGVNRPWVIAECGAAEFSGKLILATAKGVTQVSVPDCFSRPQSCDLADEDKLQHLVEMVAKRLGRKTLQIGARLLARVKSEATAIGPGWDRLGRTYVTPTSQHNPFDFVGLTQMASKRIVVCGQNLYSLLHRTEEMRDRIVDFLRSKGGKGGVDLLLMNPKSVNAVKVWGGVSESSNEARNQFKEDLSKVVKLAFGLVGECNKLRLNRLAVILIELPSLNAMFKDPTDPDEPGTDVDQWCVIRPIVNRSLKGSERPQFVVRAKDHPSIYMHYWDNVQYLLSRESQGSQRLSTNLGSKWPGAK